MMTRSMNRPGSPKNRYNGLGSQAIRHTDGGGVYKRQPTSPTARSVKKLTKKSLPTQQECISQLKSLLPRTTNEEEEISELALVERTIAYIAYLESVLSSTNNQDIKLQSTVDLLKKMSV